MRNTPPKRALVLAAGFGTRLKPITDHCPKALIPLWGVPMLERSLRLLAEWGVQEVMINAHHLADQVAETATRLGPELGLSCSVSFEPDILGTGGALKRVEAWLQKPLWVLNADVAAVLDPTPLLRAWRRHHAAAVLWMHPEQGPRTVELDGLHITSFRSRHPGTPGTATFCGLQLIDPRLQGQLAKKEGFETLVDIYERAQQAGETILGVPVPGSFWADLGTPEQLTEAHRAWWYGHREQPDRYTIPDEMKRRMRRTGDQVEGFAALGEATQLGSGTRLRDCVLGDRVTVKSRVHLVDAVVDHGTVVTGHGHRLLAPAERVLSSRESAILQRHRLLGPNSSAECLSLRGSARTFIRLRSGRTRSMLVRYQPEREENALYARHARFLARLGLRVPEVLIDRPADQFLVLEDLGDRSLQDALPALSSRRRHALYREVLEQIHRLHRQGLTAARRQGLPLMPGFDEALYRREHHLFLEKLVAPLLGRTRPSPRLTRELDATAALLLDQAPALIHRDLQSSNVLLLRPGCGLIDFQGMRRGAAAYDLASLLCDPYADLPVGVQDDLLDLYNHLPHAAPIPDEIFHAGAIQRLVQALGAYGRLSRIPGCAGFTAYIPPALGQLRRVLQRAGHLPALLRLTNTLANGFPPTH